MGLKFKHKKPHSKSKRKTYGKRAVSLLLCAGMVFPSLTGFSVEAAEVPPAPPTYLESSHISADKLPDGDFVYFGTAGATVDEKGDYVVKVFRDGGNYDTEASVELRTVDMTAVYGKDYKLLMDDVEATGDGKTLLEKYSKGNQKKSNIIEPALSDDTLSDEVFSLTPAGAKKAGQEEKAEDSGLKKASSVSKLAEDKEKQTGSETRELSEDSEASSITQSLQQSLAGSAMEDLEYSSKCKLAFAPGEREKEVRFRILEDDESEGTEGFTMMLAEPSGTELYEVATSSVSIRDDEKKIRSEISFTKEKYKSDNGKAVLTVKRTKAEQSVCSMTLITCGGTAKAGKNYAEKNDELAFAPYETEKKIEMDVDGEGDFDLILKDFKGCKEGKTIRATVEIVKEKGQAQEKSDAAKGKDAATGNDRNPGKDAAGNGKSISPASKRIQKAASGTSESFDITIYDQTYTVRYNKGDVTGKIMDSRYDPEVQVGLYYFPYDAAHKGIFTYDANNRSGDPGSTRKCWYTETGSPHGAIHWYDWRTWKKGQVWAQSSRTIPGVYYQYFAPDWASTSGFGGGQKEKLEIVGNSKSEKKEGGYFERCQNRGVVENKKDEKVQARIYAIDQEPNMTPKTFIDFFGLCAMYRKYTVSLMPYEDMSFLDGTRKKTNARPVSISIECGAESLTDRSAHDIYANPDENESNLVFKCSSSIVAGNSSIFGTIDGFKITVDPGGDMNQIIDLNYPADFKSWLNSKKKSNQSYSSVSFSASAVENEIKKVESRSDVIPYDAYFLQWINEKQRETAKDGCGYKQNLKFTPLLKYKDVKVEVRKPVEGSGHFINHGLNRTGTFTFHAGDTLDLTAASDSAAYEAVKEYQVSTDNFVTCDTIQSTSELYLDPRHTSYQIRPVMRKSGVNNFVEVQYNSSSYEQYFPLAEGQLISSSELAKYPTLKGKKILNLNPEAATVEGKMKPVPGKVYYLSLAGDPYFTVDKSMSKKVEIPKPFSWAKPIYRTETVKYQEKYARVCSVKMKTSNTTYDTNYFPFVASSNMDDNVIQITGYRSYFVGYSISDPALTMKPEWYSYELSGNLMSKYDPIRSVARETEKLPVAGYSVIAGSNLQTSEKKSSGGSVKVPQTVTSITGEDGSYTLKGIYGGRNARVPVVASDGTDSQIFEVKLGDPGHLQKASNSCIQNMGESYLKYPYKAPRVSWLDYRYGSLANNKKTNFNDNNIKIYDDGLTITAGIRDNGKKIKEAVFTVYTLTGQQKEYTAAVKGGQASFKIEKMPDALFNGDRIKVRLVDAEERTISTGETVYDSNGNKTNKVSVPITYPDVETGFSFHVENLRLVPKTFDLTASPTMNVPVLGTAVGSTQSGMISFGKTEWPETINGPTGYTLQVGLDTCFGKSKANPTANEKITAYQEYNAAIHKAAAAKNPQGGENVILDTAGEGGGNTNLDVEKAKTQNAMDTMKNGKGSGKANPLAQLQAKTLTVDIALMMQFDFVYTNTGDYEFYCGAIAMGGSFSVNKSFYALLGYVPAFVNLYGTIQLNLTGEYTTSAGMRALSAGEFDEYAGNIAERLGNPAVVANIMLGGKLQAGVGLCGIFSARGYLALNLQLDVGILNAPAIGGLFNVKGGIGVDLLLFTYNFDVADATIGFGALENVQKFDFFGGMVPVKAKGAKKAQNTAAADRVLKKNKNGESIVLHENTYGTSDMSKFGKNKGLKRAMLEMASVTPLLDNAAEHTRPQMIPLGDGKKMAVFIGARADGQKSGVLYYTIYDGAKWSEPKAVADDGTVDSAPDILKVNDKVIVAWSDANRTFKAEDKAQDKLATLGISTAIYDIKENKMGEEITLVDDGYCNYPPKLNVDGAKIFCSYMKRDVSKVKTEEELVDFTSVYSTMAYITYDMEKKVRDKEAFIEIEHDTLEDPLVMDYTSGTTVVDGDTYLVSTYTVDEDTKLDTSEDKELYLSIYNATKDKSYYPIKVTDDSISQSSPQVNDINGTLYLTWLDGGYEFNIMNVTEVLEALFDTTKQKFVISQADADGNATTREITINKDIYINGNISGSNKNPNWYKRTAKDLGVDADVYEDSIYSDLASGTLPADSGIFSQDEDATVNISDYEVVTNGDDIYIFYVAPTDSQSQGNELYGVRYKRYNREETDEYNMDASAEYEWGFGKAVQITDKDKVIDEVSLYMTEDSTVSALSNFYDQWLDQDGKIQTGENKLVEIEFETVNSLELKNGEITLPDRLVEGETDMLTFDVINDGLLTAKGFDYKVTLKQDGKETEIGSGHVDKELEAGDSEKVIVPWKMENLKAASVSVTVTETGVKDSKPYTVEKSVPNESLIELSEIQVLWEGDKPYVRVTATNIGLGAAPASQGKLSMIDKDYKVKKEYAKFNIPALASGESKTFDIAFTPAVSDFNDVGIIAMKLTAENAGKTLAEEYARLQVPRAVCASLNGGKNLSLKYGESKQLKAEVAPWSNTAGAVRYSSSNAAVATVNDKGVVTGVDKGNAVITAYYPKSGLSASITVSVAANTKTGTSAIKAQKSSVVIAAGKSKSVKFTTALESSAVKANAVTASIKSKSVVSKVKLGNGAVKITAAKKAKKGASTTVTLKSKNSAGKTVSAKITVKIQNKAKKVKAKKKSLSVKKGKTVKLTLKVTAQNKKKPTTDTVKLTSKKLELVKTKAQKGKVIVTLGAKKKGKEKITIKLGKKKVKVTVKVKK